MGADEISLEITVNNTPTVVDLHTPSVTELFTHINKYLICNGVRPSCLADNCPHAVQHERHAPNQTSFDGDEYCDHTSYCDETTTTGDCRLVACVPVCMRATPKKGKLLFGVFPASAIVSVCRLTDDEQWQKLDPTLGAFFNVDQPPYLWLPVEVVPQ